MRLLYIPEWRLRVIFSKAKNCLSDTKLEKVNTKAWTRNGRRGQIMEMKTVLHVIILSACIGGVHKQITPMVLLSECSGHEDEGNIKKFHSSVQCSIYCGVQRQHYWSCHFLRVAFEKRETSIRTSHWWKLPLQSSYHISHDLCHIGHSLPCVWDLNKSQSQFEEENCGFLCKSPWERPDPYYCGGLEPCCCAPTCDSGLHFIKVLLHDDSWK